MPIGNYGAHRRDLYRPGGNGANHHPAATAIKTATIRTSIGNCYGPSSGSRRKRAASINLPAGSLALSQVKMFSTMHNNRYKTRRFRK